MVLMKRAKRFMPARNPEPESLGDPLNGEVAQLLKVKSVHIIYHG